MKSILALILIGSSVLASPSFSAAEITADTVAHSLHKGSCAMQFALGGDLFHLQMTGFMGSFFSGKYHLSDKQAIRVGIGISGNKKAEDEADSPQESPPSSYSKRDYHTNAVVISFVAQYIWYLRTNENIHFNVGLGPNLTYKHSKSLTTVHYEAGYQGNPSASKVLMDDRFKEYLAGLEAMVGTELFLKKNLSLLAEFHPFLGYDFSKHNSSRRTSGQNSVNSEEKTEDIQYGSNGVRFGLSFYF
jgi:hypothetical protein